MDFQRRYQLPRKVFDRVYNKLPVTPLFVRKRDALCTLGIHPLQRITASLLLMAYGVASDFVDEYCRLSGPSLMKSLKAFTRVVVEAFGAEYLRSPTATNLERLLHINAARGFPGLVASIYFQHYEWNAYPTGISGAHKGK